MTNEELLDVIHESRTALADLWPWQRRARAVWQHQLDFFLKVQRDRALNNGGLDPAQEPALTDFGAPTVDDQVLQAQQPFCVHGRRMPVAHRNDPGEPCDLCEEEGNGVALSTAADEVPDLLPPFLIEHALSCNTRKPDTVPSSTGPQTCNCDFGVRLAVALGFKSQAEMVSAAAAMNESEKAAVLQRSIERERIAGGVMGGSGPVGHSLAVMALEGEGLDANAEGVTKTRESARTGSNPDSPLDWPP